MTIFNEGTLNKGQIGTVTIWINDEILLKQGRLNLQKPLIRDKKQIGELFFEVEYSKEGNLTIQKNKGEEDDLQKVEDPPVSPPH